MIRIVAAALTDPGPLIERLGLRDASAEQSRLVLDRAASLAKVLLRGSPAERAKLVIDLVKQVGIDESAVTI